MGPAHDAEDLQSYGLAAVSAMSPSLTPPHRSCFRPLRLQGSCSIAVMIAVSVFATLVTVFSEVTRFRQRLRVGSAVRWPGADQPVGADSGARVAFVPPSGGALP